MFDGIGLLSMTSPRMSGHIHAAGGAIRGNDYCALMVVLEGAQTASCGGQDHLLQPGDIFAWNSLTTGSFEILDPAKRLQLIFPLTHMGNLASSVLRDRPFKHLDGRDAITMLTRKCLETVWENFDNLNTTDLLNSVEATLTMLALSLRGKRGSQARSKGDLYENAVAYIVRQLDDPDLSPAKIAVENGCSLRSLHGAFCNHGLTVSGYIRQQRLEHCRRDLISDTNSMRVSDIAYKWGFADLSHFSKLFKSVFGVSPTEYRWNANPETRAVQI